MIAPAIRRADHLDRPDRLARIRATRTPARPDHRALLRLAAAEWHLDRKTGLVFEPDAHGQPARYLAQVCKDRHGARAHDVEAAVCTIPRMVRVMLQIESDLAEGLALLRPRTRQAMVDALAAAGGHAGPTSTACGSVRHA